ncbi:Short-chain dehydrogenase/reductase 3 [Vulpes lagopus]
MVWKWLGALVGFPLQIIYLVAKAAVGLVLPAKLRDLSRENVLITGGGRGIGRQLAREFAERGARKVRAPRGVGRARRPGARRPGTPPAAAPGPAPPSWALSPCRGPGLPTVFLGQVRSCPAPVPRRPSAHPHAHPETEGALPLPRTPPSLPPSPRKVLRVPRRPPLGATTPGSAGCVRSWVEPGAACLLAPDFPWQPASQPQPGGCSSAGSEPGGYLLRVWKGGEVSLACACAAGPDKHSHAQVFGKSRKRGTVADTESLFSPSTLPPPLPQMQPQRGSLPIKWGGGTARGGPPRPRAALRFGAGAASLPLVFPRPGACEWGG